MATATSAGVILAAAWGMISPMCSAGFGVIDDHEIVAMLDGRNRLPLSEYTGELVDRTLEPVGRFRPVYWVGRVSETTAIGERASWWYLDRIILAAGSALVLFALLRRWIHPLLAVLPSIALIAGPYSETWTRLGPSEAYAVPLLVMGIAALVHGATRENALNRRFNLAFLLLPAAGLAKENFLLLTGPIIFAALCFPSIRRGRNRLPGIAALVVTIATAIGILWQVRRFGDVYRQPRTLTGSVDRFMDITRGLNNVSGWIPIVLITFVALGACHRYQLVRNFLILVFAGLVFVIVPQAWFYSGDIFVLRYYYPAALFLPLVVGGSLYWLWAIRSRLPAVVALLFVAVVSCTHIWEQVVSTRDNATTNSRLAAEFGASILAATTLANHENGVVIYTEDPLGYYEPLISTSIFLETNLGPDFPIMLRFPDNLPAVSDTLANVLIDNLRKVSEKGGRGFVPFTPDLHCLAVLVGPTSSSPCSRAVMIRGIP